MPVYLASDVHLRLDQPERGERFADWVDGLASTDALYLVGDLCDFWFASRQRGSSIEDCPGLTALARFRARGGALTILPGNHDLWLGPFYTRHLDARFVQEPLDLQVHGLRLRLVHGHRSGGRKPWKAVMESYAFLASFGALPSAVASVLDLQLDQSNELRRERDEDRLTRHYRAQAARLGAQADLAVYGHCHRPIDEPGPGARLVILGSWHRASSYLEVDEHGARLIVRPLELVSP